MNSRLLLVSLLADDLGRYLCLDWQAEHFAVELFGAARSTAEPPRQASRLIGGH